MCLPTLLLQSSQGSHTPHELVQRPRTAVVVVAVVVLVQGMAVQTAGGVTVAVGEQGVVLGERPWGAEG